MSNRKIKFSVKTINLGNVLFINQRQNTHTTNSKFGRICMGKTWNMHKLLIKE